MLNGTQDDTKDSSVTLLFISPQIKKKIIYFRYQNLACLYFLLSNPGISAYSYSANGLVQPW